MESLTYWNPTFVSFSLAAQTAALRIGSVINDLMLPAIYANTGNLALGFWIGFGFAVASFLSVVGFSIIDRCADREERRQNAPIEISGVLQFPGIYWLLAVYVGLFYAAMNSFNAVASGMAQYRFDFDVRSAGILIVYLPTSDPP